MLDDDPRHGTYAGGTAHRKARQPLCPPCREAVRRYGRSMAKNRRRGGKGIIPIGKVRRHVATLRDQGMSGETIARAAGVSKTTVLRIEGATRTERVGIQQVLLTSTALKLLAVQHEDPPWVPAWRVHRRLQALQALGWSMGKVSELTGWSRANLVTLMEPRWRPRDSVTRDTFNAIDGAYRRLFMSVPAEDRWVKAIRARAKRCGWVPPLAWENIDDPNEQPTDWQYDPTVSRLEHLTDLIDQGAGITEACRQLGIKRESLESWCDNNGVRHLFTTLRDRETPLVEYRNQHSRGAA